MVSKLLVALCVAVAAVSAIPPPPANQPGAGWGPVFGGWGPGGWGQGGGGWGQGGGWGSGLGGWGQGLGGWGQGYGGWGQGLGGWGQGYGGWGQGAGGLNPGAGGLNQGAGGLNQGAGGFNQGPGGLNQGAGGLGQAAVNPWIPPFVSAFLPKWSPCSTLGAGCFDCNTKSVCTPIGEIKTACSDPAYPHCNLGKCSATPSASCEP